MIINVIAYDEDLGTTDGYTQNEDFVPFDAYDVEIGNGSSPCTTPRKAEKLFR